jgi:type IV pilus assembly protein PilX
MNLRSERGAVLVAGLLVLVLLSLLGAASLLSATIETKIITNLRGSKSAFYAAEAALDIAAGRLLAANNQLNPYDTSVLPMPATNAWIPITDADIGGTGIIDATTGLNNFILEYSILPLSDTVYADPTKTPIEWINKTTKENDQPIGNQARVFQVTGRASSATDTHMELVTETLQILRRPLTQYFGFFADDVDGGTVGDLNIRPQSSGFTLEGGRIYASGDIYLAPTNDITLNFDSPFAGGPLPLSLTAGGEIIYGSEINQGGGISAGGGAIVNVNIPVTGTTPATSIPIDASYGSITATNRVRQEQDFEVDSDSILRTGVDPIVVSVGGVPVGHDLIEIGTGANNFYELVARAASGTTNGLDTFYIDIDAGVVRVRMWIDDVAIDATDMIAQFMVNTALTTPVAISTGNAAWSAGALTRGNATTANGLLPTASQTLLQNSIVYSPESPVNWGMNGTAGTFASPMAVGNRADGNPNYPPYLELRDHRENKNVDFTVIDVQRLQHWYFSYLVQNGITTGFADLANQGRQMLIYATRTGATGTGAGNLQAIKLIGSAPGRSRFNNVADRQQFSTTLVPTTIVSDGPIYIEGDFNCSYSPGPPEIYRTSGKPTAIIADAVTVLSNRWGILQITNRGSPAPDPAVAGNPAYAAWSTMVNAAFFTGRSPGGTGVAAGLEDTLRLMEDWDWDATTPERFLMVGSLISLWDSEIATGQFFRGANPDFNPPRYTLGWDDRFTNPDNEDKPDEQNRQPPWVPYVFFLERESWQDL